MSVFVLYKPAPEGQSSYRPGDVLAISHDVPAVHQAFQDHPAPDNILVEYDLEADGTTWCNGRIRRDLRP